MPASVALVLQGNLAKPFTTSLFRFGYCPFHPCSKSRKSSRCKGGMLFVPASKCARTKSDSRKKEPPAPFQMHAGFALGRCAPRSKVSTSQIGVCSVLLPSTWPAQVGSGQVRKLLLQLMAARRVSWQLEGVPAASRAEKGRGGLVLLAQEPLASKTVSTCIEDWGQILSVEVLEASLPLSIVVGYKRPGTLTHEASHFLSRRPWLRSSIGTAPSMKGALCSSWAPLSFGACCSNRILLSMTLVLKSKTCACFRASVLGICQPLSLVPPG